jgi:hypothetical protein
MDAESNRTDAKAQKMFLLLAGLLVAGCGDSSVEPPGEPVTVEGEFVLDLAERGVSTWSHQVELPDGTWESARYLECGELQSTSANGACPSNTVQVSGNVLTFSGVVGGEYTNRIFVRWEAKGTR